MDPDPHDPLNTIQPTPIPKYYSNITKARPEKLKIPSNTDNNIKILQNSMNEMNWVSVDAEEQEEENFVNVKYFLKFSTQKGSFQSSHTQFRILSHPFRLPCWTDFLFTFNIIAIKSMNVSTGVESKTENVDINIYIIIHYIYNKFERILYGTWMHAFL